MTKTVAVYTLGDADIGGRASPDAHERFMAGDRARRLEILGGVRDESRPVPPLRAMMSLIGDDLGEVWLIASSRTLECTHPPCQQREGCAWATEAIGEVIADELRVNAALYGGTVPTRVLLLGGRGLAVCRTAVRQAALDARPEHAYIVAGAGATGIAVGAFLGCLEAGLVPDIAVVNDHERADEVVPLRLDLDEKAWLARIGAYDALGRLDPANRAAWQALDALQRLDLRKWQALPAIPESLAEVAPPAQPTSEEDWRRYRALVESFMLRKLGAGERSGLYLARPWIVARASELWAGLPETERAQSPSATIRRGPDKKLMVPPTDPRYVESVIDGFVEKRGFPGETAERALGPFLRQKGVQSLRKQAIELDHGGFPELGSSVERTRFVEATGTGDPLADLLVSLGHAHGPKLPGPDRLLIQCIGTKRLDNQRKMHDVIQAAMEPLYTCHLRMVVSEATRSTADALVADAEERGFKTVGIIGPVPISEPATIPSMICDALATTLATHPIERVYAAVGPATKVMNLSMALAVTSAAFSVMCPVEVAHLDVDYRTKPASSVWLPDRGGGVVARLAHDRAVEIVVTQALRALDFGIAKRVLAVSSPLWGPLARQVDMLAELALAAELAPRHAQWLEQGPVDLLRVWPARVHLYRRIVDVDAWRGIYTVVGISEKTFGRRWREQGAACHRLWHWRNDGPYGHGVWGISPAPADIRDDFDQATEELHAAGLLPKDCVPATALLQRRDDLLETLSDIPILGPARQIVTR